MPEISRFFGIIIRMYYDDHNPPHFHAEYQNRKAVFDLKGELIKGNLSSRTAMRLVKTWAQKNARLLKEDWRLAQKGEAVKRIKPLD